MTEDEVRQIVASEFDNLAQEYFAMRRPGFNIESGHETKKHGKAEFALSTDSYQGIHFYKQGNCKVTSNKSIELTSGEQIEDEDSMSIVIDARNGHIKITAPNGDLILEGANVKIRALDADGDVWINSQKTVTIDTAEYFVDATKATQSATSDMLLTAGNLSMYSEIGSIVTGSGQDPILSPSVFDSIVNIADKARTLGRTLGA